MLKSQDLKKFKLPDAPGVYLFKNKGNILYIGKATSLRNRVKSYFSNDLIQTRGPLLVDLIFKANKIDYIKTGSVLEALILEANLIKKYQPKYNTKEKDNKSFNYIVITQEDFPRVLIVRGREIEKGLEYKIRAKYGPYTNGESLKGALKIIRKIFPFRDRCVPLSGKPCFNRQLGLCPGVCDGTISKKDYLKIIRKISLLLSGKITNLKKSLKGEMKSFAKNGEYEKATITRDQIYSLEHIQDVALIKEDNFTPTTPSSEGHPSLEKAGKAEFRIEAYDAAHLSGTNNVGVMVVWENGELKKADYRKFKIRDSKGDDIGALKEMLERRLRHDEWTIPNLIVLDGGIAQMNVASSILECNHSSFFHRPRHQNDTPSSSDEGASSKLTATVVAVTKDEKHKAKAIIGDENLVKKYKKEILLINSEAHRFALAFHRQKRSAIL